LLNLQKVIYKASGNLNTAFCFNSVISKPDNPAIFDAKVEALYQMGLEASNNRNNLALTYLNKAFDLNSKENNKSKSKFY
jgi:hypothetical protein